MTKQSVMPILRLMGWLIVMPLVLMGNSCVGISQPASVSGLSRVVNLNNLATAQGKTAQDQARIDSTMARGCATELATRSRCDRHTEASDARLKELGV